MHDGNIPMNFYANGFDLITPAKVIRMDISQESFYIARIAERIVCFNIFPNLLLFRGPVLRKQ